MAIEPIILLQTKDRRKAVNSTTICRQANIEDNHSMPAPDYADILFYVILTLIACRVVLALIRPIFGLKKRKNEKAIREECLLLKEQLRYAKSEGKNLTDLDEIDGELKKLGYLKEYTSQKSNFLLERSLAGKWKGSYYYMRADTANRLEKKRDFTAKLECKDGKLTGSIEDGSELGTAAITGSIKGFAVQFEKRYDKPDRVPISYSGNMTEDCVYVSGGWHMPDPKKNLDGIWIMEKQK